MIVTDTLPRQVAPEQPRPWRAAAARDADAAATTQAAFVDANRHAAVREAIALLRGAHAFTDYPPAARQLDAARILATAIEKQARVSGLGRITIPVGGAV